MERALLATLVLHAIAVASLGIVLLPGMRDGTLPDVADRAAWIAEHAWRFRIGWWPWHLAAGANVALAIALLRARWVPKPPAIAVLLATLAALVPDQGGQIWWGTTGVDLARAAAIEGPGAYAAYEEVVVRWVAGWAAILYSLAGIGWTACLRSGLRRSAIGAGSRAAWPGWMEPFSWATWIATGACGFVALAPGGTFTAAQFATLNGVGFTLLVGWLALATEFVLRRRRPFTGWGRSAEWRYPGGGLLGFALGAIANSRLLAEITSLFPPLAMLSDITDVIYVSYLVPAEQLAPLVPEGLRLQRLGPKGDLALFTFLTYRHGHFGFRILGPLRRLMPSPIQSNWRIHVEDPRSGKQGITFISNAITSPIWALGARLLAQGMPMHVLASASLRRAETGHVEMKLAADAPGSGTRGSAPDAEASLDPCEAPDLASIDPAWAAAFGSWQGFLAYSVPQDRAFSSQPWRGQITRQEIQLGIPLEACEPLKGEVRSTLAARIAGDAMPVCFRVANVQFRFETEEREPIGASPNDGPR